MLICPICAAPLQAVDTGGGRWIVQDAMTDVGFARTLLDLATGEREIDGHRFQLSGRRIGEVPAGLGSIEPKLSDR